MSLQKQRSNASSVGQVEDKTMPIGDNVIVMEKEFRSNKCHKGNITCLTKISDTEFFSSSDDKSFKVWDQDLQGCSYTYETDKPIHAMRVTGEKKNVLISSMGDGDLYVVGLDQRNQNDIKEMAHDDKIVQLVSLGKLQNKYFATRCVDGDVMIWSATSHPDSVFKIDNVDQDESQANQDTQRESIKEEEIPQPEPVQDDNNDNQSDDDVSYDSNGEPKEKKKKVAAPIVVKKDKSGRISSDKDQMIEISWNQSVIQSSATVLCFSNYREAFVLIAIFDIKTSRKSNLKTFKLTNKPTKLFQIDENNLLVGTELGKIEHWVIDEGVCKKIYDAHPESDAGISAIKELQTQSELLRGEPWQEGGFRLIATASLGAKEFRLWKLVDNQVLQPYLKIETTIEGGIMYLLENSPTQIVAANQKTIKFYDFIDQGKKVASEKQAEIKEKMNLNMKNLFKQVCGDESKQMKLERPDLKSYFEVIHTHFKQNSAEFQYQNDFEVVANVTEECFEDVWHEMDFNETGFITWHQVKPFIARVNVHEVELAEEKRIAEEERQAKIAAEEEARRQKEAEEAARKALEDADDNSDNN